MANYDKAAAAFANQKPGKQGSLTVTPGEAVSYETMIAFHIDAADPSYQDTPAVAVRCRRYSQTTSTQQSAIRRALLAAGYVRDDSRGYYIRYGDNWEVFIRQ
jgi:hypothetical protein